MDDSVDNVDKDSLGSNDTKITSITDGAPNVSVNPTSQKPPISQPLQPKPNTIQTNPIIQNKAPLSSSKIKIKMPPVLWKESQELLMQLEKKLGGYVVSYYTSSSIVGDDVKYFYTHLKDISHKDKLFFVIYSGGGDGKSAYRIASLLKSYCNELIVVIPEIAASAATMLCLAADKLIMTPLAFLTAVDTSVTHPLNPKDRNNNPTRVELEEVKRALNALNTSISDEKSKSEVYKTIFNYIHPVAFGNMERTSTLSEMLCRDIINLRNDKPSPEVMEPLITKLNSEFPSHGYPITRKVARELGLPVVDSDTELDTILWKYVNVNRFLTEPVRTDITESFFHIEKYLNTIESKGRRMVIKNVLEKRLDQMIKGWLLLRDEYQWESLYEVVENDEKVLKITKLDFLSNDSKTENNL